MKMSDTVHIPAPIQAVWDGLNDPEILKVSIPGCQEIIQTSPTEFTAKAGVAIGPVKASFSGKVMLSELDPPNGYRISGEGNGGAAGFAKGGAFVQLKTNGDGTDLTYEVEANVGGKIAQIGQRFIDQTAKKLAEDFFKRFAEAVSTPAEEPALSGADVAENVASIAQSSSQSGGGTRSSGSNKTLIYGIGAVVLLTLAVVLYKVLS